MLVRSLRDVSLSFRTIHCGSGGNWRSVHCARRLSFFPSLVYTFRPPSRLFFLTALALRHTCETPSLSSRAGPTQKAHSTSTSWTEVNSLALSIRATRAGRPQRLESTSTGQASAHTTWSSPPTELRWRAATRATLTTGERQPFRARTPRARWSRFEPR